jgi:shikimate dehydrogenase
MQPSNPSTSSGRRLATFKLGLIGYPLGHSLSPKIQNAALKYFCLKGDYSLYPIHLDDKQGLKDLLECVRSEEIAGLNVTIPHKQNVMEFLDELTPTAKAIGAVNIIYRREDKLIGDNTDAPGFLTDLKKFINTETGKQETRNVLILGAGGSARAVVYALINDGWNVTIAARRLQQAKQLASSFPNYEVRISNIEYLNLQISKLSDFQLIVNATPSGMSPNIDQSPLPEAITFPKETMIYDLIYNPRETKLVREARAQGLQATTGLGMLIEQAALCFELWTGHNPPRDILWNAAEN